MRIVLEKFSPIWKRSGYKLSRVIASRLGKSLYYFLSENLHGKGGPVTFRNRKFNKEFMRIIKRGASELGYSIIDASAPDKIGELFQNYD